MDDEYHGVTDNKALKVRTDEPVLQGYEEGEVERHGVVNLVCTTLRHSKFQQFVFSNF